MQKRLMIENRMPFGAAKALVEMMMEWEVSPTFAIQRRDDGDVDLLMSKRTYERAMEQLALMRKLGRI